MKFIQRTFFLALFFCCTCSTIKAQNNCLDFDGIDDYVTLGDIKELNNTCEFSVEVWVYCKQYSAFATIFEKRENGFADITIQAGSANSGDEDDFTVGVTDETSNISFGRTSGNQIPLNAWFHVALVYNGRKATNAEKLLFFKNGKKQSLTFSDSIPSRTATINSDVRLGIEPISPRFPFNGKMDELRVWDFALSEERINQEMNCALQGNEDGLIAYYRFNHGVSANSNPEDMTLIDESQNCYNGTLNNFALSGTQSNWLSSDANVNALCNTPVDTCYESFVEIDRDLLISQINKGLILVSPNGDKWKLTVDNYGKVITTRVVICD